MKFVESIGGSATLLTIAALCTIFLATYPLLDPTAIKRRLKISAFVVSGLAIALTVTGTILQKREQQQAERKSGEQYDTIQALDKELVNRADRIAALNEQLRGLGERNASLTREVQFTLTGGDSFCWVNFLRSPTLSDRTDLVLISDGKYPLREVSIRVVDVTNPEAVPYPTTIYQVGTLPPGKVALLGSLDLHSAQKKNYTVQIEAENGTFVQTARMRKIGTGWLLSTKVGDISGTKVLYHHTDKEFPKEDRAD